MCGQKMIQNHEQFTKETNKVLTILSWTLTAGGILCSVALLPSMLFGRIDSEERPFLSIMLTGFTVFWPLTWYANRKARHAPLKQIIIEGIMLLAVLVFFVWACRQKI